MRSGTSILLALVLVFFSSAALAEDWMADRLRGGVMQFERGDWVRLERGDVVPDGGKIRTAGDGRVELVRGQERIALAGNTEIVVRDAAGKKMTNVIQVHGAVSVVAEKRNVQHFSVQNAVLAAVVKGTQFTVTYRNGQARVDVDEGVVQVQDSVHDIVVDVTRGQSAAASQATPLDVSGPDADKAIFMIEGKVVPAAARDVVVSGAVAAEDALDVVQAGSSGLNAETNAGGQGVAAGVDNSNATVSASAGGGNGSANVSAGVSAGNASAGASVSAGVSAGNGSAGTSVSAGVSTGNTSAGANVSAGSSGVSVEVGVGAGSGDGGDADEEDGVEVEVDLGIVEVGVSLGGGGGLGLGLGLGN